MKVTILGAGISGISTAYHLAQENIEYDLFESRSSWGGLCDNFTIDGFRFDRFVHFSHTKNEYVKEIFSKSSESISHKPICSNYYKGTWLKHPAQNQLKPLGFIEKLKIIKDFTKRIKTPISKIRNYEHWLRVQYGNYFAVNFPMKYTQKYWATDAKDLRTEWVGVRMYSPNTMEVIKGAFLNITKNTYYTNEMRYPKYGGYKSYLNSMSKDLTINLEHKVIEIDPDSKTVHFENGEKHKYEKLVSSLPLPVICQLIKSTPEDVKKAAKNLNCTSGVLVSVGLAVEKLPTDLWFYIYDKDIIASRAYSPSMKSPDNVPKGHSSLQIEIYFNNKKEITSEYLKELEEKTIASFIKMNIFKQEDIVVLNTRFEKFANVIFNHDIYDNRDVIHNYLKDLDITPIGRFGEWDYLWSDQCLESGRKAAQKIINA